MSSWEIFTWFNVGVLAVGSVAVFVLFLKRLPEILGSPSESETPETPEKPRDG